MLVVPWHHLYCLFMIIFLTLSYVASGGCRAIYGDVCGGSLFVFIGGRLRVFLWHHCCICSGLLREGCSHQLEIQWSLPCVLQKSTGTGCIFAQFLLKFYHSTQFFLAMSCEEMNPKSSVSGEELCQWRYNTCGPACPVTCQHPHPFHCSLSCVEGCHAYCPPGTKILPMHQVQF